LKPGDGFQVPPETPHAGSKNGKTTRIAITYVVEKGMVSKVSIKAPEGRNQMMTAQGSVFEDVKGCFVKICN